MGVNERLIMGNKRSQLTLMGEIYGVIDYLAARYTSLQYKCSRLIHVLFNPGDN